MSRQLKWVTGVGMLMLAMVHPVAFDHWVAFRVIQLSLRLGACHWGTLIWVGLIFYPRAKSGLPKNEFSKKQLK
ncbi:hypothetical protein DHB74_10160 [Pseudomonas sp. G11-1]|nr:hypothetical protein [Pseudomonas sp. G11-1]MCO5789941.1 hypothetical protein [Pseudomonas sp. G11-2]